jgi:hypothetical protein
MKPESLFSCFHKNKKSPRFYETRKFIFVVSQEQEIAQILWNPKLYFRGFTRTRNRPDFMKPESLFSWFHKNKKSPRFYETRKFIFVVSQEQEIAPDFMKPESFFSWFHKNLPLFMSWAIHVLATQSFKDRF